MGERIGDEIADKVFGADTEEKKVFATDSATDCLDNCKCGFHNGWGNCIPTDGSAGDKCCTTGYKWKCCQVQKEFIEGVPKDLEKLGRLCFETLPVCSATFCESEKNYYAVDKSHPVIGGGTKPSECGAEFIQAIRGDFFQASRGVQVVEDDECQQTMKAKCDCGWGNCFPREGRVGSKCCLANYDLVCCKGSGGNTTTAEAFKVLMMLVILILLRVL
uniref:Uncharacterized protein n=1 Tax=Globodera pallida TaxID=36090 RepID=A0A183BRG6_GLOPA